MTEEFNDDNFNENEEEKLNPIIAPASAAFFGFIAYFFLHQIVGSLLTIAIFGTEPENANPTAIRLLTIASQLLFILLPSLYLAKIVYQNVPKVLRIQKPSVVGAGVLVSGFVVLSMLLQNYMYLQKYFIQLLSTKYAFFFDIKTSIDKLDVQVQEAYSKILAFSNGFDVVLIIIVVAITPAICEEMLFRGYLQKSFELRYKPIIAISITAALFSFAHFNIYSAVALFGLGLYLGFVTYISNSIIPAILIHFANNIISLLAFFILGADALKEKEIDISAGVGVELSFFFSLLILFLIFIIFIRRYYHKYFN